MTGFSPLSDLIGQSQCSSIFSGPWQRILGDDRISVISGRGWVIYFWHFGQNSYYVCLFWALLDLCYPPVFPYPAINASSIPRLGVPSQIMSTPFGWPLGVAPPTYLRFLRGRLRASEICSRLHNCWQYWTENQLSWIFTSCPFLRYILKSSFNYFYDDVFCSFRDFWLVISCSWHMCGQKVLESRI